MCRVISQENLLKGLANIHRTDLADLYRYATETLNYRPAPRRGMNSINLMLGKLPVVTFYADGQIGFCGKFIETALERQTRTKVVNMLGDLGITPSKKTMATKYLYRCSREHFRIERFEQLKGLLTIIAKEHFSTLDHS